MKKFTEGIDISDAFAQMQQKLTDITSLPVGKNPPFLAFKSDIIALMKKMEKAKMGFQISSALKNIAACYQSILQNERHIALDKFQASGGDEQDFVMRPLAIDVEFQKRLDTMRNKFELWHKSYQEEQRNALATRRALLGRLRSLINGESSFRFDTFKEIQQKWKQVGDFSGVEFDKLWVSYHALVDRVYNHRSIFFELKQLDEKKNLEKKLALCEQTEKLIEREKVKESIEQLHILHYEFKNIGPVPREHKEAIWSRFKKASDALRQKWEKQLKVFHRELESNREKKEQLLKDIASFAEFTSTSGIEWSKKTKNILALKEAWEAVGQVPKQHAAALQKSFWSGYKQFFEHRKKFFNQLDKKRFQHLQQKEELLKKAIALKDNTDWQATSHKFKELQQAWKKVGALPKKHAEKMTNDFNSACNFFFERQKEQRQKQHHERVHNFSQKMIVCQEIEKASQADRVSLLDLTTLVEKYNAIGPVPYEKADELEHRFNVVINNFFGVLKGINEQEKDVKKFEIQLSTLNNDVKRERKLHNMQQSIRKKIHRVEHDVSVFKNNLEFFNHSKRANEMKDRLNIQLEKALMQLKALKKQASLLKSMLS